jgi:acetoin utilization protein AcuB
MNAMNVELLMLPSVPCLKPTDTCIHASEIMQDCMLPQLPVVNDLVYLGLVNCTDLDNAAEPEKTLAELQLMQSQPQILVNAHPYDALQILRELKISVLPVLDTANNYAGCVTAASVLDYFGDNAMLHAPGGVIVLSIHPRNYSLVAIARICENEDVTITNLHMKINAAGMWEVTLKVNKTLLDGLTASFERHEYEILEVYGINQLSDDLNDNYKLLWHYLNM